ncbi:MAG: type II/IV secretion system protein, partial [Candidatus Methylopumilus sp.]
MNQVLITEMPLASISAESIRQARQLAQQSRRRLIEVLQDQSELPQDVFLAALGEAFQYPTLDNKSLHELSTDFDVLPFAEAYQRECIPLRTAEGALLIAIADPFADGLANWLLERVRRQFELHLAHYADVSAFLSRHEETLKAMDKVLAHEHESGQQAVTLSEGIEQLSLSSISADSSP